MITIKNSPELGKSFNEAFDAYKSNFLLVVLACLLAMVISAISCGICGSIMSVGLVAVYLRILRKDVRKPEVGDVFAPFKTKFLVAFVTLLVLGVGLSLVNLLVNLIPILGQIVSIALSFAVIPTVSTLAICFIAEHDLSIGEAIKAPFAYLKDKRFWVFALICFIGGVVAAVGLIACAIGIFFTIPLGWLVALSAYDQMFGERTVVESSVA